MSRENPDVGLATTAGAALYALASNSDSDPQSIGVYHLLEKIGEGGMGEVWLAEQDRPIQRQVAIKIIKLGMDTREVVARFESERQALAMMNHSAIASVFDAGSTPEGRPFFVMEYIPGSPITQHCDRFQLSIRERLELFMQVCAGVQHAHHKAIIHRDLKPSNVLIAVQDGKAMPKIIDFGIAKAIGQQLTEKTLVTVGGIIIGTLEYMSPEQADFAAQDVDTRTDVYSLGVILYELLTGVRPLELKSDKDGIDEIRRTIREEEPKKPSTRIGALGKSSGEVAKQRQTSASNLIRELSSDLDWITMKALEKDRARRYSSPSDLAADIERYLTNQPVLARPPSTAYRVQRFVQRHRFGVAVASAGVLVLFAFAVTMAIQARRIAQERDRANAQAQTKERIADFMKDLFSVPNPTLARGNTITAREILDQGVKKIDKSLDDQPTVKADLIQTMGEVYVSLGLYGDAERLAQTAFDTRQKVLGEENASTVESLVTLAYIAKQQRHLEESENLNRRALEAQKRLYGEEDRRTLHSKAQLANVYTLEGKLNEAAALFENVIPIERRVLGDDPDTVTTLNDLAVLYDGQGRKQESTRLFEEILDRRRRMLGEDHPDTVRAMNNVAYCYQEAGRYDEAKQLLERAAAIGERIWGPRHPSYGVLVHTLGELETARGDLNSAESYLLRAHDIYILQPDVEHLPLLLYELAQVSARRGKPDRALDWLKDAVIHGYKVVAEDTAFASIRSDPRFIKLTSQPSSETRKK